MGNAAPFLAALLLMSVAEPGYARSLKSDVRMISGHDAGKPIGTIALTDSARGVVLTPNLKDLPPGLRGFHVHEHGNCGSAMVDGRQRDGAGAGGHWNPAGHDGMAHMAMGNMPLGDLPGLRVNPDGRAVTAILASRIRSTDDLIGKSLMIHDAGGKAIACGLIKAANTFHRH
jgi:Cu-Zn family superoxide dismutase